MEGLDGEVDEEVEVLEAPRQEADRGPVQVEALRVEVGDDERVLRDEARDRFQVRGVVGITLQDMNLPAQAVGLDGAPERGDALGLQV